MKHDNPTPANDAATSRSGRRGFLAAAAAGLTGIALAPGVRLIEIAQAAPAGAALSAGASSKVRWGMLIDSNQCSVDCKACVTACNSENGLSGGTLPTDSQWIRKIEIKEVRSGRKQYLPMMCQHCAEPPCVDVCPTGASFKRADGIVLVDRHRCIGCRYCLMACPYKARSFVHAPVTHQKPDAPRGMGTAEACNLCANRVDRGEQPACVAACTASGHAAFLFGDLNDPSSEIANRIASYPTRQIRENLNLDTGVRYLGI